MIHELAGDLLLSKADLICHGVAPNDDFKNGLALSLREAFPAMYKDFRHYCRAHGPKPGGLWLWQGVGKSGRPTRIAALLTQAPPAHAGGHAGAASTTFVNHALHELKKLMQQEGFQSVALPKLATGVGGLQWQHVLPLIQTQLGDLPMPVLLYTEYRPGEAAAEPLG